MASVPSNSSASHQPPASMGTPAWRKQKFDGGSENEAFGGKSVGLDPCDGKLVVRSQTRRSAAAMVSGVAFAK